MRQRNVNDILENFIPEVKKNVEGASQLTDLEISEICKSIFTFIKEQMARRDMPIIHIKYFGKFRVFPSTVLYKIAENRVRFQKNFIDKQTFEERDREYRRILIKILLDQEQNPEKYEEDSTEPEDAD